MNPPQGPIQRGIGVSVPRARWARWIENFETRHGHTTYAIEGGALTGRAEDGSDFVARLPFDATYDGPAEPVAFGAAVSVPDRWGVLLVRKGGFAVARLAGERVEESKVGQRHVQGRTKAGGQSQQRFARRRDNQARQAYEAAADHAARVLPGRLPVVTGGDHAAVEAVLGDRRLAGVTVVEPWLPVPDPRRATLDAAIAEAVAIRLEVTNA
jgi:hypothetical protein